MHHDYPKFKEAVDALLDEIGRALDAGFEVRLEMKADMVSGEGSNGWVAYEPGIRHFIFHLPAAALVASKLAKKRETLEAKAQPAAPPDPIGPAPWDLADSVAAYCHGLYGSPISPTGMTGLREILARRRGKPEPAQEAAAILREYKGDLLITAAAREAASKPESTAPPRPPAER